MSEKFSLFSPFKHLPADRSNARCHARCADRGGGGRWPVHATVTPRARQAKIIRAELRLTYSTDSNQRSSQYGYRGGPGGNAGRKRLRFTVTRRGNARTRVATNVERRHARLPLELALAVAKLHQHHPMSPTRPDRGSRIARITKSGPRDLGRPASSRLSLRFHPRTSTRSLCTTDAEQRMLCVRLMLLCSMHMTQHAPARPRAP